MKEKKDSINISLMMIMLSVLGICLCCLSDNQGIWEVVFALTTGLFGSSFATLWIFVYEYNKEKRYLLNCIFTTAYEIMEDMPMISYKMREFFYTQELECYLEGKYYVLPTNAESVKKMSQQEKCLYELCRFVDEVETIGYKKVESVCNNVEKLDFWTDSFRNKNKRRDVIMERISMPFYEVFISAPAMENGYLFNEFREFTKYYSYSAEVIYPLVVALDQTLNELNEDEKYLWLAKKSNMRCYVHEKLWIFRDAFFNQYIPRKQRRLAMKAFVQGVSYEWIR